MESLKLIDVTKKFGSGDNEVVALDDINFAAKSSELTLILGPSGSGKSTLLTILGGLQPATKGKVLVNDRDLSGMSAKETDKFRLDNIGFILQSYSLVPYLTVRKQFELVDKVKADGNLSEDVFNDYLKLLGIENMLNKYPDELSGGQAQRVSIARALYTDPEYILADEPTSALDSDRVDEVGKLFKKIANQQKKAVVVVTHDLRLRDYADSIYKIIDGKVYEES